jgi:hypothetical protein
MDDDKLVEAARNELVNAAEWRNRFVPDERDPRYEAWLTANLLEVLLGRELPASVQVAMARAARILYQHLAELRLPWRSRCCQSEGRRARCKGAC